MARGRGYGGPIIITSSGVDDALLGTASSRAGRLASHTINDQDELRRQSRRQDRALLDSITTKMATGAYDPIETRRAGRVRVVPYSSGKGAPRSYVTYYVGDPAGASSLSTRYESVTPSLSVLTPRARPHVRTYSFQGRPARRHRLEYLDLQSTYRPRPTRQRRFDYLDLSLPLDIHNYVAAGTRYTSALSYVPRYYPSSFDDADILYRPRHSYLTDLSTPMYRSLYSPSHYTADLYHSHPFYDYDDYYLPPPRRSSRLYPVDYDLQLYPELTSSAPRRRASVSYLSSSRLPLAPARPAVSYYDDIEWPDYRPSAIRFQPVRDGSVPAALAAAPSTNLAVRNARRSLFRIERELGDFGGYGGGYGGYDDLDYVDYTPVTPVRRSTVIRTGGALPPTSSSTVRRSVTTTAPRSRYREIEARLDLMTDPVEAPATQLSTLRSRASDVRSMMDREKLLLDRYLPAPSGPIPAVEYEVESKYDELAQRMPSLGRLSGHDDSGSSASIKPYTPAPASRPRSNSFSGPSRPSARPPLSDVRKRCRQVLCKTKGDPSYYR